jgi:hypothetical protein
MKKLCVIHHEWVVVTLLWHTARNPNDLKTTLGERAAEKGT